MRGAISRKAAAAVLLAGLNAPIAALADTPMTAGVILDKMPVRERTTYIMGIVEGLAYARFRSDSAAAGDKVETGMNCIYRWFYKDANAALDRIEAAFRQYADYYPSIVLAAMIKKECGE